MIYSLPKPLKRIDMVLWGIDMQVTDKMIKAALESWFGEPVTEPYDEHVDNMRFAIQAAIQAAWVEFDIDNPATYPRAGAHAFRYIVRTTNGVQKITTIAHWDGRNWFANQMNIDVTHWMPLPEFKE
jgi:hypothetical protein